ncbi:hypothetical protein KUF54_07545 [Comamonas sp. Y33R10-2]|nr:hypothetical protein [Comamonas sp. Y33R10-2]QXZ11480.1 hypothetical protein KUF54_07545 [Comamonas sp. Y33R10-2]
MDCLLEAVAVNMLAGITGSSSGGLSIALQTLGADYKTNQGPVILQSAF